MIEKNDLVEVTIKIPKGVLEFYKAVFAFEKCEDSLPEFLGTQITHNLEGHFNSDLETLLDYDQIAKAYGLSIKKH